MDIQSLIRKHALHNASKYHGKANIGAVIGKVVQEDPALKARIDEIKKLAVKVVADVGMLSVERQLLELQEIAPELLEKKEEKKRELPELTNAVPGKVVMRIAPYPSGPLHIGNAKPLILNDEYVKRYKGRLILAIDDTIGSDEKNVEPDAYNLIPEGCDWLNVVFSETIFKSDRLELYYKHASDLITKDAAYVCSCDSDTLRANREKSVECSHRKASVSTNEKFWNDMLSGKLKEGSAVLRLKTDMQHKNPAFRDRVLLRISDKSHPRVGTKFHVWPLLEFSWAIDDHLLGMTHILRGKDLMMESEMERFIWDIFHWPHPEIIHAGLVTIAGVKISKSKSAKEVKSGAYSGWDDPRTWSLQSLKRRGIFPEALRSFLLETGIGEGETTVPIDNLYSENRKILDKLADRYFMVEDPVKIVIENAPSVEIHLKKHPEFAERGLRVYRTDKEFYIRKKDFDELEDGSLYRLMDCLNFKKVKSKFVFDSLEHSKYKDSGKKIMHYVPANLDVVKVEVLMPDASVVKGIAEPEVKNLKVGSQVQFERFGFVRLDSIKDGVYHFWYTHP
ncbi:MAG: glutamate--tRNA ligase [Candidatus Woesearchaeota archaeon]